MFADIEIMDWLLCLSLNHACENAQASDVEYACVKAESYSQIYSTPSAPVRFSISESKRAVKLKTMQVHGFEIAYKI
jgi:hypothetical protein